MKAALQSDLTPPEHEHSETVIIAAIWLADQTEPPQPIIPVLRQRFNLTPFEVSEACALAKRYRIYRRAHG